MAQMNFLQMVQRAYREGGHTGSGPASVLNQSGRNSDVVEWTRSAFEEIQTARPDWDFDWAQGTFALVAGTDTYDPTNDFGIVGGIREFARSLAASYSYPTASGAAARLFMRYLPWQEFRALVVPVVPGNQPVTFAMRPDGDVQYYPRPNVAVTVVHEYVRNPQALAADADIPRLPAWAHMAIVWKSVMIGCGRTKDFSRFDTAEEEYEKIFQRMMRECTQPVMTGGALA